MEKVDSSEKEETPEDWEKENWDDEDEDLWINPFYLPEVMIVVVNYISNPRDLRNVRMVCKLWRNISLGQWRSCATFVIAKNGNQYLPPCEDDVLLPNYVDFKDHDPLKHLGKPFRRFKIQDTVCLKSPSANLIVFLQRYGANLTYLDLTVCHMPQSRDKLRKILLQSCPELKTLTLRGGSNGNEDTLHNEGEELERQRQWHEIYYPDFGDDGASLDITGNLEGLESLVISLSDCSNDFGINEFVALFNLAPNIKSLKLERWHYFNNYYWPNKNDDILKALMQPSSPLPDSFIKLERLEFTYECSEATLLLLCNYIEAVCPPLKSLKLFIHLTEGGSPPTNILRILTLLSGDLIHLELNIKCNEEHLDLRYTSRNFLDFEEIQFPELTHLCLRFNSWKNCDKNKRADYLPFNLNGLRNMPKLKIFRCGADYSKILDLGVWEFAEPKPGSPGNSLGSEFVADNAECLSTLKEFHFEGKLSSNCLSILGLWANNLSTLKTILTTHTFPTVMESFPQLQNLVLLRASNVSRVMKARLKNCKVRQCHSGNSTAECKSFKVFE